jgi:hypothetical protein
MKFPTSRIPVILIFKFAYRHSNLLVNPPNQAAQAKTQTNQTENSTTCHPSDQLHQARFQKVPFASPLDPTTIAHYAIADASCAPPTPTQTDSRGGRHPRHSVSTPRSSDPRVRASTRFPRANYLARVPLPTIRNGLQMCTFKR